MPVSSCTSRSAACSEVSPLATAPLGKPQRVRLRVAIMATQGRPSRKEMTAPPEECSLRVFRRFSGIWADCSPLANLSGPSTYLVVGCDVSVNLAYHFHYALDEIRRSS